jgi:hypothetical protein
MMNKHEIREARHDMADIATELAALQQMSVSELHEKYREVFGEPSRSRNKDYLRKKVAWRIQELVEGGLSKRARGRIAKLSAGLPDGWRRRLQNPSEGPVAAKQPVAKRKKVRKRDPRLPESGSTLRRIHKGKEHVVTVCEIGFEYGGKRYSSLSKVAQAITGTPWNGFLFFGLKKRTVKKSAEPAA